MEIVQRGNYLIYFDDVRVDPYVINWGVNTGLFANDTSASIVMHRTDQMDKWKGYLTQVRIFGENPFTKKFTMLFEGELMNRSWNDTQSDMGRVTYTCKGFYHWLDIPVPMGIQNHELFDPSMRFIYEAQNINIEAVSEILQSDAEVLMKDKNIEEVIKTLLDKLTIGYYDVAGSETAFAFSHIESRFNVMVDVLKEFREAGFLDLFTFTQASQIDSFFVYLNQVLSQLMFEFYQDRDGAFRIKTPSWSEAVLKAHVLDASIVGSIDGADDWENEPTRVLAIGGNTQMLGDQQFRNTGDAISPVTVLPMGLYIGDPQKPDTEEYYSQQVQWYRQQFGGAVHEVAPGGAVGAGGEVGPGDALGNVGDITWFDNVSSMKVTSGYGPRWGRLHEGTDYPFSSNTPVYNIGTDGVVSKVGRGDSQGNYVHVKQTIGGVSYEYRYYHLNSYSVSSGQKVASGELLAKSGNTGSSTTGAHLHFEVWKNGASIDPVPFLASMKSQMENVGKLPTASNVPAGKMRDLQVGGSTGGSWLSQYTPQSWKTFEVTSYNAMCPPLVINGRRYAGCTGITATGMDVKDGTVDHRVIAVDPSVIPLHSIVEIEGLGLFNAADTGGAIKGARIDLLKENYEVAIAFGRKNIRARILRSGKGGKGEIIPAAKIGANPTSVSGSTAGYSSTNANVDTPRVVAGGFKRRGPGGPQEIGKDEGVGSTKKEESVGVAFPFGELLYKVPSNSKHLEAVIKAKPAGLDSNLVAAVIAASSNWREKYSTTTQIGVMGVSVEYANKALAGHNLMAGSTAIELSSVFLADAIAHFSGRISFGLAAYQMGNFIPIQNASQGINLNDADPADLNGPYHRYIDPDDPTSDQYMIKSIGALDFSKARVNMPTATVAYVDHVMTTLAEMKDGDFIKGDPHLSFGNNNKAEYVEIPDYESSYKPRLSDEEKKYKVNLVRVQQELIRNDSAVLQNADNMTADELIYRFARYTMQLHRAKTHNVNVSLMTCLPFLRVGLNAWLEPTRKNVVFYITNVSHQGSFAQGCFTQISGGFVRDPDNYQDIDDSIFVGEVRATSEIYGDQLSKDGMDNLKAELNSMHDKGITGQASDISVLKGMYSSMNKQSEYTTKWNEEYTFDGIAEEIRKTYAYAPDIVKERKEEIAKLIADSEAVFVKKLMFMR